MQIWTECLALKKVEIIYFFSSEKLKKSVQIIIMIFQIMKVGASNYLARFVCIRHIKVDYGQ